MADQDELKPWTKIQYPWINTNPDLASRESYQKQIYEQLGKFNPALSKQFGHNVYTRSDGTNYVDYGKDGTLQRNQVRLGAPGLPQPVDYPLRPLLLRADQQSINPWQNFGDISVYNPADGTIEARLKRAALLERYEQTRDVDPGKREDLVALKSGDQTMSAIANDLAKLHDKDINTWAKLGASVINMSGEDLRKKGIDPAYQDLLQNISRAKVNPYFTPPATGAAPNPMQ